MSANSAKPAANTSDAGLHLLVLVRLWCQLLNHKRGEHPSGEGQQRQLVQLRLAAHPEVDHRRARRIGSANAADISSRVARRTPASLRLAIAA